MAEVLVAGTGGYNQGVVGHLAAITQLDAVIGDIDANYFTEQHPRVVLAAQVDRSGEAILAGDSPPVAT